MNCSPEEQTAKAWQGTLLSECAWKVRE